MQWHRSRAFFQLCAHFMDRACMLRRCFGTPYNTNVPILLMNSRILMVKLKLLLLLSRYNEDHQVAEVRVEVRIPYVRR